MKTIFAKLKNVIGEKLVKTELFSETVFETVPFKGIYIAGCRKIKDYGKERILLECIDCTADITGEGLYIENLVNGQISVMGKVLSLEFTK